MIKRLITTFTAFMSPEKLMEVIKLSPWLIIPIFGYILAQEYIASCHTRLAENDRVANMIAISAGDSSMEASVRYFTVRSLDHHPKNISLTSYLDVIHHLNSSGDTPKPNYETSYYFLTHISDYYMEGANYQIAKHYLKEFDHNELILTYLMKESECHDEGINRFIRAITSDSLINNQWKQQHHVFYTDIVEPFLKEKKVSRAKRMKIIEKHL